MTLDPKKLHINIAGSLLDRDRLRNRIAVVVDEVSEDELITIATLLGAEFSHTEGTDDDDWRIASYKGERIEFTERLSMHRCAAAFCIVANVFGDNP